MDEKQLWEEILVIDEPSSLLTPQKEKSQKIPLEFHLCRVSRSMNWQIVET